MSSDAMSSDVMSSGITEADITRLVQSFYARVQKDEMLAPIFATKIKPDGWDTHMDHITDFWCSIFLKTRQFSGNPMRKHLGIDGITPAHFTHWLALFHNTAQRELSAKQAEMVHTMAQRIAQSLQMGLAFHYDKAGDSEHAFKAFGVRE